MYKIWLSKKKRNAYVNMCNTFYRLQMTPYMHSNRYELTLLEFMDYFIRGEKQVNIYRGEEWFEMSYDYYDGIHLSITIFKICFYSYC